MTTPTAPPHDAGFGPADLQLLAAIRQHDLGLRAVLCTLACHGVALRRDDPGRAKAWLDELAPHPMFKGGQFLFDLLEWEDFMLDGDAPPLLHGPALQQALQRLTATLRGISAGLGSPMPDAGTVNLDAASAGAVPELPALHSSHYLFHDVVLGALALITPHTAA